jgi:hypothetical protein
VKSTIVKTVMTWSQSRIGVAHGSSKAGKNMSSTVRRRFVNPVPDDSAGPHTQGELARFGDVHPMQMSKVVQALEHKRLIVRAMPRQRS